MDTVAQFAFIVVVFLNNVGNCIDFKHVHYRYMHTLKKEHKTQGSQRMEKCTRMAEPEVA